MMKTRFAWNDGPDGSLVVEPSSRLQIARTHELTSYVHKRHDTLGGTELELLGAVAFYLALREYGRVRAPDVLLAADRALDSFYPVIPDASRQQHIDSGIRYIKEAAFPHRAEEHDELLTVTFNALTECFRRLGCPLTNKQLH